jgi:hypothetical protein
MLFGLQGTPEITYDVIAEIADYWRNDGVAIEASAVTKTELHDLTARLLAAYVYGVVDQEVPPLTITDPMLWTNQNRDLRQFMVQNTGLQTIWVDEFLYNLWEGTQSAKIDSIWLSPKQTAFSQNFIESFISQLAPGPDAEGEPKKGGIGWLFLIAGAGAVALMFGKRKKRNHTRG